MKRVGWQSRHTVLLVLILLILAVRLLLTFSVSDVTYDSYYTIRQVDAIKEHGIPLYNDELSFGGKINLFLPFFYYFMAFFSLFLPTLLVMKLLPILLFGVTLLFVYGITKKLTRHHLTALISTGFAGFLPVVFTFKSEVYFINSASPLVLTIPLFLAIMYFFINVKEKHHATYVLILTIILALTTPLAMVLLFSYFLYLILLKTEALKPTSIEKEIMLFSFFLIIWINLVAFKKALLFHGTSVIWQNIPNSILSTFFTKIGLLDSIYAVGIIPLLFGVYAIFRSFTKRTTPALLFNMAVIIAFFVMLWFRLIPLGQGMLLLGVSITIIGATSFYTLITYLKMTKFERYTTPLVIAIIVFFVLSSASPAVLSARTQRGALPTPAEHDATTWLLQNTAPDSLIVTTLGEGSFVEAQAQRPVFMDHNFLLVPVIDQRYNDLRTIMNTKLTVEAVKRLQTYNINYIYISKEYERAYGMTTLFYAGSTDCLSLVYNKTVLIYQNNCFTES